MLFIALLIGVTVQSDSKRRLLLLFLLPKIVTICQQPSQAAYAIETKRNPKITIADKLCTVGSWRME